MLRYGRGHGAILAHKSVLVFFVESTEELRQFYLLTDGWLE